MYNQDQPPLNYGRAPTANDTMLDILRRLTRMETRMVKLMERHGLDSDGYPQATMANAKPKTDWSAA